eukprot:TRINITY_DN80627_c0_g1_i1.p1 TRINITY_DN80627_c0_g1~~TRINITY_DN80627_c0_g1_i1.p1  ORF type:complete len:474 (-),score=124.15 TRINITY_DN80627_c0_g1_i1:118-1539(-)
MALTRQHANLNVSPGQERSRVAVQTQLANSSETILVTACGRSVQLSIRDAQTISLIKNALQKSLNMHGQEFELYDSVSNSLLTDGDLRDAIAKKLTPLTATLSEASIHYIENRREELSQMQWKLLRDKVDGLSTKVNVLTQQLAQLADALSTSQVQLQEGDRKLQVEVDRAAEDAKEQSRQLGAQLAERIEAVAQILHSERNMREALKEGIGRQVQGVRDALEGDRATRRSELQAQAGSLEDLRQALIDEARNRECLEEKFSQDLNTLQDRLDAHSRYQAETKQDIEHYMKTITSEANKELEDNTRQVLQLRSSVEKTQIEAAARLQRVEERFVSLENRHAEHAGRVSTQFGQLRGKTESLYNTLETVRLKDRAEKLNLNSAQEIADISDAKESYSEVSQVLPATRTFLAPGGSVQSQPAYPASPTGLQVPMIQTAPGPMLVAAPAGQVVAGSPMMAVQPVVQYARGPSPRRF